MPVFRLGSECAFPPAELCDPSGLLAVGGDLEPQRLLLAYSMGIFPWYEEGQPILWHSPDPRTVLEPSALHVSRSLAKVLRRERFQVRLDTAFAEVVRACSQGREDGTWITAEMIDAYIRLHELGFAHSAETWEEGELVGGIYGVSLGGAYFGESMFYRRSNASKVALVTLVRQLQRWNFDFLDCQMPTRHLEGFGAVSWPRRRFLEALSRSLERETARGPWQLGG